MSVDGDNSVLKWLFWRAWITSLVGTTMSKQDLRPSQSPVQWVTGLSLGVKRPKSEAVMIDYSFLATLFFATWCYNPPHPTPLPIISPVSALSTDYWPIQIN